MDKKFLLQEILANGIVEISLDKPLLMTEGIWAPARTRFIPLMRLWLKIRT